MQDRDAVQIAEGDVEDQLADWRRVWGKGEGERLRRSNRSGITGSGTAAEARVVVKGRHAPLLIYLAVSAYGVSVI
jgi:hypothetical protein